MAGFDDTRAGWEIYRNSGFSLSLEEINERLKAVGYAPVAQRSYKHYQRLERRGMRRYISINRLDTMEVANPFKDDSLLARYAYSEANVPTSIVIHKVDSVVEVLGVADSLSDSGAEILVSESNQVAALRLAPPPPGTAVTVNFLSPPGVAYGNVDFVSSLDEVTVKVQVTFRSLTPVQNLLGARPLPVGRFRFVVGGDAADRPLDVVSQDVYWLFQTVELAREIVNEMLRSMTGDGVYALQPTVERLTVASPLDAWLNVNITVYLFVYNALDRIREGTGAAREVGGVVTGVAQGRALADRTNAQAAQIRAQTEGIRLDNEAKEIRVRMFATTAAALEPAIEELGVRALKDPEYNVGRLFQLYNDLDTSLRNLETRGLELPSAAAEE